MLDLYKIDNRIALLRREKGFTGEKFAEALGVSPQAVSKWENGKCLPETALLPAVAALLGTSIDSILIPQELLILDARYTCGDKTIVVTDAVNRAVVGNTLSIKAECPIGGNSVTGLEVFVLTVKYQTPDGIFYAFVPQGETLELNVNSKYFTTKAGLEMIGAYYGIGKQYKSVLHKMHHYEYFKWDEIHVNHETFPSSPGTDESEYLTLVYMNKNGINVISCEENGVLCYTQCRTALEIKDTSACMLKGIMPLEWGADNTMPCTWAGALYAALKFMGENYTYTQIMGMSGACYRIVFCEVWDWSALDALVAFSYDIPLYHAIGYEPIWACRLDKDDRIIERKRIVADILNGRPVIAINLRVAPEWGVITGYSDKGKTLYCRTYFDGDRLNEDKDYLETENWPFLITHFGEKHDKPSDIEILNGSLRALIQSFEASQRDGYYQGKQGYEKWISGLRNDKLWSEDCPQNDLDRRFDVHLSTVYHLVDARRCAASYLTECCDFVDEDVAALLMEMADIYRGFTERLHTLKEELLSSGVSCFLGSDQGKVMREKQAILLESALQEDLRNVETAKRIMDLLQKGSDLTTGNNDRTIKAVFNHVNCIYEYTVTRGAPEKIDGNSIVHITSTSPQEEVRLIEKTYGRNDSELYRYDLVRSFIQCIPQIYQLDFTNKTVLKEDLSTNYISGYHFDEDNENGLFFRKNFQSVLQAVSRWHTAFWENHEAFGKIGLDWRFETKENLMAHISMMEKDYWQYWKNEEAGKIPKEWEAFDTKFENRITPRELDYFTSAIECLKKEYWPLVESRFHTGKNITIIHGDMHPGTVNISNDSDHTVKFDGLGAVRMGLPTEDLAMLIALHIEPDSRKAQPLLDFYYGCLCEKIKDYSHEVFMHDYKIAVLENMFFTIRLINRGIYDFRMRDRAIRAYESFMKIGQQTCMDSL